MTENWEEMTTEEKWRVVQQQAKLQLSFCDWTQLPDSGLPLVKRLEWQEYRDNLRTLQNDFANPDDVIFPNEPE